MKEFSELSKNIKGDISTDESILLQYSTDASVYKEKPLAVIRPIDNEDIKSIIKFANAKKIPIIPRGAGTSLAGQVVGSGMVVDISKYLTKILEVNSEESWVRVQPGVVLDELNQYLEEFGLFFGPETSTGNRCNIGGMVGNNSCGSHSLIYGSTRDHLLSVKTILSDGSEVEFKELTLDEFQDKFGLKNLEGKIYKNINSVLSIEENKEEIRKEYPDKKIKRRNTGYAIDLLLETEPFSEGKEKFNFSRLIAGSEGTLAFITEIKLNLVPAPPKEKGVICVHCKTLEDTFKANLIALKYNPGAIELIDKFILDCTKENIEQSKNRFFIEGDPAAILVVEFARDTKEAIEKIKFELEKEIRDAGLGYHFPILFGNDINKVWSLRKAGLGLLSNVTGDAKPVAVIEDTAVTPELLPQYMDEFKEVMKRHGKDCVYYAHIATGEIHLRPVLNLKDPVDVELFHTIAEDIAKLVKKYKGSLSGEHGDGRLRGEFIPYMIGDHNYKLIKSIKRSWDPNNIFNPRKIVDTPKMNESLRYKPGQAVNEIETIFDFSEAGGFLRAVEKCNGSGDCRKSHLIGGTMCPSFMATKDENTTTRARANMLREIITNSNKKNPFDNRELFKVLDLCLSCKGCKSECPSNVDMAKLKAEFLQNYNLTHGVPIRSKIIANIKSINRIASIFPGLYNLIVSNKNISGFINRTFGFSEKRSFPELYKFPLHRWLRINLQKHNNGSNKKVYLFVDEFTDYNDVMIGIKAVQLLTSVGYRVGVVDHPESGRTFLSKGLLNQAREIALENIAIFSEIITEEVPLIGIEPSAILSFRDEYPNLVGKSLKKTAEKLAANCLTFDEFIAKEIDKGNITSDLFTTDSKKIKLHGHCHQKAIANSGTMKSMLSLPQNYKVEEIQSGCCGMAGSFGYEAEHYELSMQVGELVLFPAVRETDSETIISAPGTSCRHQIKDGTGRNAYHPVEILFDALINETE